MAVPPYTSFATAIDFGEATSGSATYDVYDAGTTYYPKTEAATRQRLDGNFSRALTDLIPRSGLPLAVDHRGTRESRGGASLTPKFPRTGLACVLCLQPIVFVGVTSHWAFHVYCPSCEHEWLVANATPANVRSDDDRDDET
jgi:hypothetical protein